MIMPWWTVWLKSKELTENNAAFIHLQEVKFLEKLKNKQTKNLILCCHIKQINGTDFFSF